MEVKIKKDFFSCILTTLLLSRVWVLGYRVEDTTLWQFYFSSHYLFDSIFSEIAWIDKLNACDDVICFPNNGCH